MADGSQQPKTQNTPLRNDRYDDQRQQADNREFRALGNGTRSEVHSTYLKLTWQNAFSLLIFVGAGFGLWNHLGARMDSSDSRITHSEKAIADLVDYQRYQTSWLEGIAVKTGVGPPGK